MLKLIQYLKMFIDVIIDINTSIELCQEEQTLTYLKGI